ncbi:MAG: hypothetical protein SOZ07_08845 [Prevotella sp.]|nr:hypothetical protein [Prevotella sp.]
MYRIAKEIHIKRKPLWLVDTLFHIKPSLYRNSGSKEQIENNFKEILSLLLNTKVRWHNGNSLLSKFQTIHHTERSILVKGKRDEVFLSFRIEPVQQLKKEAV